MIEDQIGFVATPAGFVLGDIEVIPRDDYKEVSDKFRASATVDGFLHATPHHGGPRMLRLPASHRLLVASAADPVEFRRGVGGMLCQTFAYLFGMRVQFHNWWADGRVPVTPTHNIALPPHSFVEQFLFDAISEWRSYDHKGRKLMSNLLYMHSRVPGYQWDWERFAVSYMVTDGIYRLLKSAGKAQRCSHPERIQELCRSLGVQHHSTLVGDIVDLRNELFHETLWGGETPGTAVSRVAFAASGNLKRLNDRLIARVLGHSGNYPSSPWWTLGTDLFT